jgi:predicted nucleotidyltransferase
MELMNLGRLPEKVRPVLQSYMERMADIQEGNLISAIVYGSSASGDFSPKSSDLNLLFICEEVDLMVLKKSLQLVNKGIRKNITAPLFLTKEYMETSADVFPIEFLDMKESHLLIYGKDLLSDLVIDLRNLRHQCEEQIKGKLIRVRQAYLEVGLRRKGIEALLKESLSSLIPVFRNLIRLKGLKPSLKKEEILGELARTFDLKGDVFIEIWRDRQEDEKIGGQRAEAFLGKYISQLEKLAVAVDKL